MEGTEVALAKQLADAKAEAAAAGASANEAAGKIAALAGEVSTARQEVASAYEKAAGYYKKALTSAREAAKDSQAAGKATVGDAALASAYMQWQQAQGLRLYASMLESLAKVEPALSDRASYASKATEAREAVKAAIESAKTDMEAAKSAFESTRVQGGVKERLDELAKKLETAISVSGDESTNVSPELLGLAGMGGAPKAISTARPAPALTAEPPAPAAPTASSDEAQIVALLKQVSEHAKAKRYMEIVALTSVDGEKKVVLDTMKVMIPAVLKTDSACRAKFGKPAAEVLAGLPGVDKLMDIERSFAPLAGLDAGITAEGLSLKVTGERAVAQIPDDRTPTHFKRVDGRWYLTESEENPETDLKAQTRQVQAIAGVLDTFAADVQAGKYADANAAKMGFVATLQAKMGGGG
jgi:hypothetical protein